MWPMSQHTLTINHSLSLASCQTPIVSITSVSLVVDILLDSTIVLGITFCLYLLSSQYLPLDSISSTIH